MWTEPICDRTQRDIELGNSKGFCNAVDLNRLEDNCVEVARIFGLALERRGSGWTVTDLPTTGELERILRNVRLISGSYRAYQTTPPPPQAPLTHWQKWNAAEQIVGDIRGNYMDNVAARHCAGEIIAGEGIGVL